MDLLTFRDYFNGSTTTKQQNFSDHLDGFTPKLNTSPNTNSTEGLASLVMTTATGSFQNVSHDNVSGWMSESTELTSGMTTGFNSCEIFDLIVSGVFMTMLLVSGLFGNTISIAAMWGDRNRSNTAFLLIVLAISDDLVLLTRYLMNALPRICRLFDILPGFQRLSSTYLNAYMWGVVSFIHMADSFMVVVLAFNRYLAVKVPHVYKVYGRVKHAKVQSLGVYLFSLLFNLPRFLEAKVVVDENGELRRTRTELGDSENYRYIYKVLTHLAVAYVVPVIILIFLTYKLVVSIRKASRKREQLTKKDQEKNNITATLVSIVVIFMICHLVIPIRRILESSYSSSERRCPHGYYFWVGLAPAIVCVNSAVNFFIYLWFSPQFRARVVQLLCSGKCGTDDVEPLFTAGGTAKITPLSDDSAFHSAPEAPQSLRLEVSG